MARSEGHQAPGQGDRSGRCGLKEAQNLPICPPLSIARRSPARSVAARLDTSVNPARSTGPALFVGGWALEQLWLFWVAPIIGAAIGAVVYKVVADEKS